MYGENILVLSKSDSGGAGRAALRVHNGLRKIGASSEMLVEYKSTDTPGVRAAFSHLEKAGSKLKLSEKIDRLPLQLYSQHQGLFSPQWVPNTLSSKIKKSAPDIVNIQWTGHSYLSVGAYSSVSVPVVLTLQDMWAFTGGCHYAGDCKKYVDSCGACPHLSSRKENDLSRAVWRRKRSAWKNIEITVVATSRWIADCARQSSLLGKREIEVIPNCLDIERFKPLDKKAARHALGLPQEKKIILFGAIAATTDVRKGFHLLVEAMRSLEAIDDKDKFLAVVFGSTASHKSDEMSIPIRYLGNLTDDYSLALAYSAADVMVVPSTQEAFGQTASEAMSCGTPVVAFSTSGLIDIVDHKQNGYLATPFDPVDLSNGILWILADERRRIELSQNGRKKAETLFSDVVQAEAYRKLFLRMLSDHKPE